MAGERLDFDIFARLREDGFAKAAKAAEGASGEVVKLAERLDKLGAKSTEARVGLKGSKEALAQLDALQLKMLKVGDKLIDPKIDLRGTAEAQAKLAALDASMDKLGNKSKWATGLIGSGGLAGPTGMGALIGAGVVLSPILTAVAFGVGGFGLAAAGAVGPVVKAAQATGGLHANMAKLNPEQQKLAQSLLDLGKQYKVFEKALEPQVLSVFGKGVQLAGHLLHDVQPIAAATGKALGGMLSAIDKEFQSGTWQKFFAFMAKNVGPDIKLISDNFVSLMQVLPGVMQELQPLATDLLKVSDAGFKVIGFLDKTHILLPLVGASIGLFLGGPVGALIGGFVGLGAEAIGTNHKLSQMPGQFVQIGKSVYAATPQLARFGTSAEGAASASDLTAKGVRVLGQQATATKPPVFNLTAALNDLTSAQQKNVDELLTEQGNLLGWQQALKAAEKQLDSNTAGLKGNSDAAIANRQALFNSTQQAEAFAESQSHAGGDIAKASQVIEKQIHFLEIHAGKSKFARDEIHALRLEEAKLHDIRQQIKVSGSGTWQVSGQRQTGTHPMAARGAYIRTGQPGVDDQLVIAQRGELIVPTPMVSAGLVDHLRGMIPGFATGGVVSSYSGSVGGMPPWLARQDAATLRALDAATAAATAAGIRGAQAASGGGGAGVPGPGGGAPAANAALARRLYPEWGSGREWAAWNALTMGESGWSNTITNAGRPYNPYTVAYGIPQALPAIKMGAAANPPSSNPTAQIRWMHGYITGTPGYGDPISTYAKWLSRSPHWYAQGGVVGGDGKKKPPDPQRAKWLAELARDVKVLEADVKHAAARRKVLNRGLAIDELWFLTHPDVEKGGIGWNEHEKALRRDRRLLRHFNTRENAKETLLGKKIALLRQLTGFPKGAKYGGPGSPAPGGGAGDGSGGGDGGGTGPAPPPGPPPIPPPPMPEWMVAAGLGGSTAAAGGFTFPSQMARPMPEPVAYAPPYGGSRSMGGGGGEDLGAVIAELRALHQGVVRAVGMVAPGTARGVDRSLNSMAGSVAGRFS